MTPLRERIPAALSLQPMTVDQLARCLSVHTTSIRRVLNAIGAERIGTQRTKGRPWIRYGMTTTIRGNAR